MKELENEIIYSELLRVINKMTCSMLEIKQKHPHRNDLIGSLDESINSLQKVFLNRFKTENTIKVLTNVNLEWSLRCLKAEQKLELLDKEIKTFKENETYIRQLEKENNELKNKVEILIKEL